MNETVLRTDLLASFESLQARFDDSLKQARAHEADFDALRQRFADALSARLRAAGEGLPPGSPVRDQVLGFIDMLAATQAEWTLKVAGRNKGIAFRARYEDSLLVFVNGKVKSGKSSLGNYMAWGDTDPTEALKQEVPPGMVPEHFSHAQTKVESGDAENEAASRREFRVGATEATSSIQGFSLPGLTWVDSPGLHSLNHENGALARAYVEHADLILYTMKSDSPGRKSDIDEIRSLLNRDKKVLLLLTGSDDNEDVRDKASGTWVSRLVMKSAQIRARQRDYVASELKSACSAEEAMQVEIVSLSAHYAQLHASDVDAFEDSGVGHLCRTLHRIAQSEGVRMKQRTPMTNLRNFLAECRAGLEPYQGLIGGFKAPLHAAKRRLEQQLGGAVHAGQQELQQFIDEFFAQLESDRADASRVGGQLADFEQRLNARYQEIATRQLAAMFDDIMAGFADAVRTTYSGSGMVKLPGFELATITEKIATVKGGTRTLTSLLGSIAGGIAGFFLGGGPPGAALGMSLGGGLGGASGSSATTQYREVELTVGDNLQEIRLQALRASQQALDRQMRLASSGLWQTMEEEVDGLLAGMAAEIDRFDKDLHTLVQATDASEK
ncbi:hypothetical protein G4G28_14020 [Massilia sp. Dwa41.01b]|uniref:dynamin family protein n=1 Tax=unclassified Massilia TaxID=2609279 RepID=UPI0016027721|nr:MULTISPECIES: dynamin family protein [unclassified Massilia]QNA89304.1 hypothetical protein G4G28_14020 [Massilia sp. Dwa41.01b]QNB00206.1 hypothetical protein G4G31_17600 [Massilia sp. Se16.2.3]